MTRIKLQRTGNRQSANDLSIHYSLKNM